MNPLLVAVPALALAAGVVAGLVAGGGTRGSRRRLERQLRTARESVDALQARVEELSRSLPSGRPGPAGSGAARAEPEFVITSLADLEQPATGDPGAPGVSTAVAVPSGPEFAAVAVRESLLRVASLAYGVRRALSAENRNRIRFEVRQEIKRARRRRRRDLKEARRQLRARTLREAE
jgi:hypothetical protein